MTEDEAVEKLKQICQDNDPESEHCDADELLVEFLRDQGFPELANTFDELSQNFWYA